MKSLLFCLAFITLSVPALGQIRWTHRVVEGEDGGINGSYFLFETFRPDYKDGTLMSVLAVRAIYAQDLDDIVVVDYSLRSGIQVKKSKGDRKSFAALVAGKEVKLRRSSDFSIEGGLSVGYFRPKEDRGLTKMQREALYNLVQILAMQRSPLKSEQAAGQSATNE